MSCGFAAETLACLGACGRVGVLQSWAGVWGNGKSRTDIQQVENFSIADNNQQTPKD